MIECRVERKRGPRVFSISKVVKEEFPEVWQEGKEFHRVACDEGVEGFGLALVFRLSCRGGEQELAVFQEHV